MGFYISVHRDFSGIIGLGRGAFHSKDIQCIGLIA